MGLFADGKYDEAAPLFQRLGDYQQAATYAAYSQGLVLWEQERYAEAESLFAQCRDFMYGDSRYRYCHAWALLEAGDAQTAAASLEGMDEFENAALLRHYCAARYAESINDYENALYEYEDAKEYSDASSRLENLRIQVYLYAIELKQGGSYQQAMELFNALGEYLSSPAYARECKDYYRDQDYAEAERLEAAGDLRGAYEAFKGLTGYNDAETRAADIAAALGISEETTD